MEKYHFLILFLLAVSLSGIYFSPEIIGYLAGNEVENVNDELSQGEICESLDADITVLDSFTNVRNVGSAQIQNGELSWENSSGSYSKDIRSLNPTVVQSVRTGNVEQATITVEECDEPLADYP